MKNSIYIKIQKWLFIITGILTTALLVYLWVTPNVQTEQKRQLEGYRILNDISYREWEDLSAPTGKVREFSFLLEEEMEYDTTLVFRFSHQNAEVYIGYEKVYSLQSAPSLSIIRTPGVNWAMIPIYREDIGKEVRIVLTPVYKNYQNSAMEFLMGSKLAIYKAEFMQSFPEMVLSLIDILAGMLLLCAAVYFTVKKTKAENLYALAFLAISLGLWNFTQTDFVPFLLEEKNSFVYYISLTMLMLCIIPLIKSVKKTRKKVSGQMQEIWCVICSLACIVQLVIQMLGFYDLREMLKITHGMILITSLVLIFGGILEWNNAKRGEAETPGCVWILGAGALLDLILYYSKGGSAGLLFVLLSILCYVLIEGIRLFFSYMKQKQMLEEKETQLTLSRITTMISQIRSHFVFNILNAISGMCKYDPEKADETVVRFARYLRNNIDIMEDDKAILFSAELEHLEDYVVLEQVRFGDKIEFYSDIKTDQFMIPPLILQPIVENAIKHGLTKKQSGGTVILRTWEEETNIKISVEDDGVGFEMKELEKEKSVGLKNIRYRLKHLMHGTLEIQSQEGAGTTVTITIPKKEAEACI